MSYSPSLYINEARCRGNIARMAQKARSQGLIFRPHFKTHQSLEIGRWFKEEGIDRITVSSLAMAEYFSSEWNDISIAFPLNILEIEAVNRLAARISLNVQIESAEAAVRLKEAITVPLGVFLKIDTGYHRTGLLPTATAEIEAVLDVIQSSRLLGFKGFLTHAGHTYSARGSSAVLEIHEASCRELTGLKQQYEMKFPGIIASAGDTPSCSLAENFYGIDEIRPGNFVFYDLMQLQIGSCNEEHIALSLVCPVVAVHPERNEAVIHGGAVHFSKEGLQHPEYGTLYGQVMESSGSDCENLIPGMFVKSLSQEHGIVQIPASRNGKIRIGELLHIVPVHSCLAVAAFRGSGSVIR